MWGGGGGGRCFWAWIFFSSATRIIQSAYILFLSWIIFFWKLGPGFFLRKIPPIKIKWSLPNNLCFQNSVIQHILRSFRAVSSIHILTVTLNICIVYYIMCLADFIYTFKILFCYYQLSRYYVDTFSLFFKVDYFIQTTIQDLYEVNISVTSKETGQPTSKRFLRILP